MSKYFLILIAILFSSCFGSEFVRRHIFSTYYVVTTDHFNHDVYIGYKLRTGDFVGVIRAQVIKYGHNSDFIFAVKRSNIYTNERKMEGDYFIIPIEEDTLAPEQGVIGPLSASAFRIKLNELGIKYVTLKNVSN